MNVTTSVGRVLGDRYQVDELLGRGGMASVWRGRDLRLDRAVAIKELAGPWLADRRALRQFDREARMAARLAHPNIVAVHDVGIHDFTPYIVMELIEGATVAQLLLTDGPMSVEDAVAIAAQACDGLAAAHAAGVIHRDIKPANLMLTDAAVVKICDFGIAGPLLGAADATVSGPWVAMGTSKYMAPEQASGERVDARADLYALGCTLYTMLAGTPPFQGTIAEVLQQHQVQVPPPLGAHRADVPGPLEALVMRLLAKDPEHRPTCVEVKAVLAGLATDATPAIVAVPVNARAAVPAVGPRNPRPPWGSRRRARAIRYWPVAAIGVVAVLILATAAWRLAPRETGNTSVAPTPPATPSLATTAATSSPPPSSAPAPTKAGPASQVSSPSPPAAPSSQAPPIDPIAALRLAIQQQVSTGNLNPDKASALYTKVDAIAHAANAGNTTDEAKNIKAFKDNLMALRTGGQLSVAGYNVLSDAADAISATLP
jgi:eukaryotic-like serine/threonine-protein kinase